MSMRAVGWLPAGAQMWNKNTWDSGGTRAAYCSTLAIYIYDVAPSPPRLEKILVGPDRTICCISWSPHNPNALAVAMAEDAHNVAIWDVGSEAEVRRLSTIGPPAAHIQWSPHHPNEIVGASLHGAVSYMDQATGAAEEVGWQSSTQSSWSSYAARRRHMPRCGGVRLSPRVARKALLFYENGLLIVLQHGAVQHEALLKDEALADAQFDPLSDNYLIVGCRSGLIHLYDIEARALLQTFEKVQGGLQSLAWVPGAPGSFVSAGDKAGVVRVWNVSQRTPTEHVKARHGGFHALGFLANSDRAFAVFKSGAVGLCDLGRRQWTMFGDAAHTDTVFCAGFCPARAELLATCSFDGSVRLWDTATNTLVRDMQGEEVGVLYSLAWGPGDSPLIATCSSRGQLLVWDTSAGRLQRAVSLLPAGREEPAFGVAWSHHPNGAIAVAAHDGNVYVVRPDGTLLRKLPHPAACYGVDWATHERDLLASTCSDGVVRIWDVGGGAAPPVKLAGHEKKVFNVAWSPLLPGTLLSGSDDLTVRVWTVGARGGGGGTSKVLSGHTRNVRALAWSYEVPWLAYSGSWDGTIRVWDTRTCQSIRVLSDHHADIYSIASHPARPFVLVSTSRDTTMRTWLMDELVSALCVPLMLGAPPASLCTTVEAEMRSVGMPRALCGDGARALAARLDLLGGAQTQERLAQALDFFLPPRGVRNLSALAAAELRGERVAAEAHEVVGGAQQLEAAEELLLLLGPDLTNPASRPVRGKRMKQAERLELAAGLAVRLGRMREYCELRALQGEWAAAVCAAPAVSLEYWRELCGRYARALADEGAEPSQSTPLLVASAAADAAVAQLLQRGEHDEAQALARAAASHRLPLPADGAVAGEPAASGDALTRLVADTRADAYLAQGQPALAACCFLAQGEGARAVGVLLRTHELELALALTLGLGLPGADALYATLARRFERLQAWGLALSLVQRTRDAQAAVPLLAARHARAAGGAADLFAAAELPPQPSYRAQAEQAQAGGHVRDAVRCLVVCGDAHAAVALALPHIRAALCDGPGDAHAARELLAPLRAAELDEASGVPPQLRAALLACSAYEGALHGCWRGYLPVLPPLLHAVSVLSDQAGVQLGLPAPAIDALQLQVAAVLTRSSTDAPAEARLVEAGLEARAKAGELSAEHAQAFYELQAAKPAVPPTTSTRALSVAGASLPASSQQRQKLSLFTQTKIHGPAVLLEDGMSSLSLSEAVMWAKLHPFSPLHTGSLLNPF